VGIFGVVTFILCQPAIFFLGRGVIDELDFWGGTFCLVLFATIETILFTWIFGIDKAWEEMHRGAELQIPKIYKFIMRYVTPVFLLVILCWYLWSAGIDMLLMKNVSPENKPFVLGTRIMLLGMLIGLAVSVKLAWRRKRVKGGAR